MALAWVSEGEGDTVVFVHGTPSSSFEFRHVVEELREEFHCLAPDHLGFGRSAKPADGDYSLVAHQRRFEAFLQQQDVQNAVFVLHDFGAAIALPALWNEPGRCRGVVLLNTFLWPASGVMTLPLRFYATALGRWVYRTFNVSVGLLLPYAWGTRKPLTPALREAYQAPLASAEARTATAALPGELIGSTLAALESRAPEVGKWPVRAVWGMADALVGLEELGRWREALPGVVVDELHDVGHFVAEEAPDAVADAVRAIAGLRGGDEGRTNSAALGAGAAQL